MHFLRTCTSRRLFSKTTTIRNLKLQFKNVALCSIFLLDPVSSVQFLGEIISDQSHAFSQKSPLLAKIQSDIIRAALKLNSPELQIFEYPMILSLSLSLSLSRSTSIEFPCTCLRMVLDRMQCRNTIIIE